MIPHVLQGDVALFLDVDGTLIDIAPHPDAVVVPSDLVDDLAAVNAILDGAVALVSGRTISNLDSLFHPLRLRTSGVHGAEYRFDPAGADVLAGASPLPAPLWEDLLALIGAFPGTMAENKAYSLAVHYRTQPSLHATLLEALKDFVAARADLRLRILPGHFVFELKRADFDKGTAIETFLSRDEFKGRRPVFVGDDVTDWPGFSAAVRHGGLAYAVGRVAPDTSGTFPDPAAVRHWLKKMIHSETVNA